MKKILLIIMGLVHIHLNYALQKPIGLVNLGNTCYLNATLQCLLASDKFRQTINSYVPKVGDDTERKIFTLSIQDIIKEMNNGEHGSFRPTEIVNLVNSCIFQKGFIQQDAEEFFIKLLDRFYPEQLEDIFKIHYNYRKTLDNVEFDNKNFDVNYLNISYNYLPENKRIQGTSIETLIKSFFTLPKTAMVEGKNNTGTIGVYFMTEENNFKGSSDILVVTAPRVADGLEKHTIPFWSLQHQFYLARKDNPSIKYWYSLLGVVLHAGPSLNSGHYVAITRYGNQWYLCNDSDVKAITDGKAGSILQGQSEAFGGKPFQTYMFFFERAQNQNQSKMPLRLKPNFRSTSDINKKFLGIKDINDLINRSHTT